MRHTELDVHPKVLRSTTEDTAAVLGRLWSTHRLQGYLSSSTSCIGPSISTYLIVLLFIKYKIIQKHLKLKSQKSISIALIYEMTF